MINKDRSWLKSWLIITAVVLSGCKTAAPDMEVCVVGTIDMGCYDRRLPKKDRSYPRRFDEALNYVCTNVEDFNEQKDFYERELRECEAKGVQ